MPGLKPHISIKIEGQSLLIYPAESQDFKIIVTEFYQLQVNECNNSLQQLTAMVSFCNKRGICYVHKVACLKHSWEIEHTSLHQTSLLPVSSWHQSYTICYIEVCLLSIKLPYSIALQNKICVKLILDQTQPISSVYSKSVGFPTLYIPLFICLSVFPITNVTKDLEQDNQDFSQPANLQVVSLLCWLHGDSIVREPPALSTRQVDFRMRSLADLHYGIPFLVWKVQSLYF